MLSANATWQQGKFTWNSGSSTTAALSLTDTNTSGAYNDFVLTDIALQAVSPVPEPSIAWLLLGGGVLTVFARRRALLG